MALVVPFAPSIPFQQFTTPIDGVNYIFNARWNGRDNAWYFDVLEENETPIVYGIKVVLGCILGRYTNHTLFRDGIFAAADMSGAGVEAGLDDFGVDDDGTPRRVVVVHLTLAEVLSLRVTSTFPDATAIAEAATFLASTRLTT